MGLKPKLVAVNGGASNTELLHESTNPYRLQ